MTEYSIVTVLWEDHTQFSRAELPASKDLSDFVRPSLTIGILYKKTGKFIVVAQNIERYEDRDEADFMIIYSSAILGIQEYGKIQIDKLRPKGG